MAREEGKAPFNPLLPWGSRRRYWYQLVRVGITVWRHEGWRAFWTRTLPFLPSWLPFRSNARYEDWIIRTEPDEEVLALQRFRARRFKYRPLISVLVPVWNTPERYLREAIESVMAQTYDNWELCLADDSSTLPHVAAVLREYAGRDRRVLVKLHQSRGQALLTKPVHGGEVQTGGEAESKGEHGIAANTNRALAMARGEFVALLDHDDVLAPSALYEVVKALNEKPDLDFIYTDEDKLTKNKRTDPFFKPDWSPDYFLSCMYTCHLGVYRKSLADALGGFRSEYDGAQDYDFVLRLIEKTQRIHHIPKVLYHWRIAALSAASGPAAKPYAYDAAKRAIAAYMERNGIAGEVVEGPWAGSYRVKRAIIGQPLVSIIIPTRDKVSVLRSCVQSVLARTQYTNYEVLIVDNRSDEEATLRYYRELAVEQDRVRVLHYDRPFNYSAINNWAVEQARGEHIVLLNNDTKVISGEWLSAMLEHSQRPEVGAVGAKLLFPDGTIQHCGVALGMGVDRVAGHLFTRRPDMPAGGGRTHTVCNYSAVTGACLMMRKAVYEEVGGLDENLAFSYNDVDLCLKVRGRGYLVVFTPYARLYHLESYSRGYQETPERRDTALKEAAYFRERWGKTVDQGDPYFQWFPIPGESRHGKAQPA